MSGFEKELKESSKRFVDKSSQKFVPIGDRPLAEKSLSVRVDVDVDAAVRALGDGRSQWLRDVITRAARAELMGGQQKTPQ